MRAEFHSISAYCFCFLILCSIWLSAHCEGGKSMAFSYSMTQRHPNPLLFNRIPVSSMLKRRSAVADLFSPKHILHSFQRNKQFLLSAISESEENTMDGTVLLDSAESQVQEISDVFTIPTETLPIAISARNSTKFKSAGAGKDMWQQKFAENDVNEWRDKWKDAKPQRSIFSQGLARDRWTPLDIAGDFRKLSESWDITKVIKTVADPELRNFLSHSGFRTIFFTVVLQLNVLNALRSRPSAGNSRRKGRSAFKDDQETSIREESKPVDLAPIASFIMENVGELYRRDWSNIEAGVYRPPYDANLQHRQYDPFFVIEGCFRQMQDSAERSILSTRGRDGFTEVRNIVYPPNGVSKEHTRNPSYGEQSKHIFGEPVKYPNYYLQNFHFQTGGWMSMQSAKAYEFSTEMLFSGCQDAMQRQALKPIGEYIASRTKQGRQSEQDLRLLEVACGTGRFHTFIKDNWPRMQTVASDLSPFYLRQTKENLDYFTAFTAKTTGRQISPTKIVQCPAEALSFSDRSFDVVACTYLFHEIPLPIRRAAAREMFRVLATGGIVVLTDSTQLGDRPELDHIGEAFPAAYHEPFYRSYFRDTDLIALFQAAGFIFRRHQLAHMSKILTFQKP